MSAAFQTVKPVQMIPIVVQATAMTTIIARQSAVAVGEVEAAVAINVAMTTIVPTTNAAVSWATACHVQTL
jgi:hypothetical protein